MLDKSMIKNFFKGREFIHFLTLKPPRDTSRDEEVGKLANYLTKRQCKFWIVKCKSDKDFIHYHGLVSYPNDTLPDKMEANKLAFQRKVNRDIGFSYPLQQAQSLDDIYKYVHNPSNAPIWEALDNHSIQECIAI